jgi:hypothetical protein
MKILICLWLMVLTTFGASTNYVSLTAPLVPSQIYQGSSGNQWQVHETDLTYLWSNLSLIPFDTSIGQLDRVDWTMSLVGVHTSSYRYLGPLGAGNGSASETWRISQVKFVPYTSTSNPNYFEMGIPGISVNTSVTIPISSTSLLTLDLSCYGLGSLDSSSSLNYFMNRQSIPIEIVGYNDHNYQYGQYDSGSMTFQVQFDYSYVYTPTSVPEPNILVLLVLGGIIWLLWRKPRK